MMALHRHGFMMALPHLAEVNREQSAGAVMVRGRCSSPEETLDSLPQLFLRNETVLTVRNFWMVEDIDLPITRQTLNPKQA
eukprot:COSAG02_NODE_23008_length_732_cov_1.854660_1_plen_81_part_00